MTKYLDLSAVWSLILLEWLGGFETLTLMTSTLCIVHITTKFVLLFFFADSKENRGIVPCLMTHPSSADHVLWLQLLAIPSDSTCWQWVSRNYSLFLSHNPTCWPLSQQTLERPAAPTSQKMNDVSLWSCFSSNSFLWLSPLKPLLYSSHLRVCLLFTPKATFSDLQISE